MKSLVLKVKHVCSRFIQDGALQVTKEATSKCSCHILTGYWTKRQLFSNSWGTILAEFEPVLLPQKTICPSVALAKGQIHVGNSGGSPCHPQTGFSFLPAEKSDKKSCYFRTVTTCDHLTISSGNCEVSNSEVEHHFLLAILPQV